MDSDTAISKKKIISTAIRMVAYLLAVTLIFSVISVLCRVDTVLFCLISPMILADLSGLACRLRKELIYSTRIRFIMRER